MHFIISVISHNNLFCVTMSSMDQDEEVFLFCESNAPSISMAPSLSVTLCTCSPWAARISSMFLKNKQNAGMYTYHNILLITTYLLITTQRNTGPLSHNGTAFRYLWSLSQIMQWSCDSLFYTVQEHNEWLRTSPVHAHTHTHTHTHTYKLSGIFFFHI